MLAVTQRELNEVITYCETTGKKVFDPKTKLFTGSKEIENVLLWVAYKKTGESFRVDRAYYSNSKCSGDSMKAEKSDINSREEYIALDETNVVCCKCQIPLESRKVVFNYLKIGYKGIGKLCPRCGILYLTESVVNLQRNTVERLLETK